MGRAVRDGAGFGDQIEFLTPRESLFGGDGPAEFSGLDVDDMPDADGVDPPAAWLMAATVLAVVALIGGGIIVAAPWSSPDANGAPPPTTIVPPPIESARASVARTPPAGTPTTGFVFDPLPTGFALDGAWRDTSTTAEQPLPGWGEVWATPDATATGGAWFSVTLLNRRLPTAAPGATRVQLAGRVGVLERRDDGTLQLSAAVAQTTSNQYLTVRSFGRSADQLVALFGSIGIDDDRPQLVDDRVRYLDAAQLDGFDRLASQQTDQDLVDAYLAGAPNSTTSYGTGRAYIIVDTMPRDDGIEPVGRLAIGPARIFPTSISIPSTFTGEALVLGASSGSNSDEIVARWHVDDTTIVVRTNMPVSTLLPMLPTIRQTSEPEWSVAARRAAAAGDTPVTPVLAGGGTQFGGGTGPDGTLWSASMQPPDRVAVEAGGAIAAFQVADEGQAHGSIQTWSFPALTVVTAVTTTRVVATTLRVSIGGSVVGEAPIIELSTTDRSSSFEGRAGAVAFAQPGPFQVEMLDADGYVAERFASPGYQP